MSDNDRVREGVEPRREGGSVKIGIGLFFVADGRVRAVARKNGCGKGLAEDRVFQSFEQEFGVASGEVGSADGTGKDGVSGEEDVFVRQLVDDAVGRVSGDVVEVPDEASPGGCFFVVVDEVVHVVGRNFDVHVPLFGGHVDEGELIGIRGTRVNGASEHFFHAGGILHVVEVLVRNEEICDHGFWVFGFDPVSKAFGCVDGDVGIFSGFEEVPVASHSATRINTNPIHGKNDRRFCRIGERKSRTIRCVLETWT